MNVKTIIKKFLSKVMGQTENKPTKIVNRLVDELNKSIASWTIGDSTLAFHTAFVVYVPEKDYKDILSLFGLITKDVSVKFNDILRKTLKRNPSLKYETIADNWAFVLDKLGEGNLDCPDLDKKDDIVTYDEVIKEFAAIRSYPSNNLRESSLISKVKEADQDGTGSGIGGNSNKEKALVLCIGPVKNNLNDTGNGFNWPIDVVGNVNDYNLEDKIAPTIVNVEILSKKIHFEGQNIKICRISLARFFIGGSSSEDIYAGTPIVKLSTDKILNPHIEIKVENKRIYIRSLAPTSLCGRNLVPRSKVWEKMPLEDAYVKLNNEIELKFLLE